MENDRDKSSQTHIRRWPNMHAVKEKHKQNKSKENMLGLSGYMFCLSLSIVVCVCVFGEAQKAQCDAMGNLLGGETP